METYQHLSNEERFYIHQAVREGKTQKEIAEQLDRPPSTICREMKRNMGPSAKLYTFEWAKHFVRSRKRYRANSYKPKIDEQSGRLIVGLIKKYLSPEQVSGYLARHHQIFISHETIYRYIYRDKALRDELRPYLRQGKKLKRKKYGTGARVNKIPNRTPIEMRPQIVDSKQRIGDWECDTVIGKDRKCVLVTLVERKSLFTLAAKVKRKTATMVSDAIIRLMLTHIDKIKTLTFDNGTEFVQHNKIERIVIDKTIAAIQKCSVGT